MWRDSEVDPYRWLQTLMQELNVYDRRFPGHTTAIDQVKQALLGQGIVANAFDAPAFGYTVSWDDHWSSVSGLFDDNWDELVLFDEFGWVAFRSRTVDAGDVQTCIARADDEIGRLAYVATAATAVDGSGQPFAGSNESSAWSAVDYTNAAGDQYRRFHRCWTLVPGEVTLLFQQDVLVENYEEHVAHREHLLAALELPDFQAHPEAQADTAPAA
jgi:hypothetical protein